MASSTGCPNGPLTGGGLSLHATSAAAFVRLRLAPWPRVLGPAAPNLPSPGRRLGPRRLPVATSNLNPASLRPPACVVPAGMGDHARLARPPQVAPVYCPRRLLIGRLGAVRRGSHGRVTVRGPATGPNPGWGSVQKRNGGSDRSPPGRHGDSLGAGSSRRSTALQLACLFGHTQTAEMLVAVYVRACQCE